VFVVRVIFSWLIVATVHIRSSLFLLAEENASCNSSVGEITHESLLAAAMESPRLVGLHDKEGWLAMFDSAAVIEDPVGSPPSGPDMLERSLFYDTFIAPNNVTLNPMDANHLAWVAVKRRVVLRSVRIDAQLPNGAIMRVPVHAVYRFDARLKAQSLRAHWEVMQNVPVLKTWWDAFPALIGASQAFIHIFRVRGLAYTWNYLLGTMVFGAGASEKRKVLEFAKAVSAGDFQALSELCSSDAIVALQMQDRDFKPFELGTSGLRSIEASGLRSGGEWVSFDFAAKIDGSQSGVIGVGVFHFTPGRMIQRAELYFED